ncbi:MAG: thiamine phosphate synthase [Vibrio hibernica]
MIKIKFPPQYEDINTIFLQCLSAANQVGFTTDHIQVSYSDSGGFIYHDGIEDKIFSVQLNVPISAFEEELELISNELDSSLSQSEVRHLVYLDGASLPAVLNQNTIYIDALFHGEHHDIWLNTESEFCVLRSAQKIQLEPHRHFAWFFACLSLDFPLEDALTLARAAVSHSNMSSPEILNSADAGLNVSRETWPKERFLFPVPLLVNDRVEQELELQFQWESIQESLFDFAEIERNKFRLYPVVTDFTQIETLLKFGVKTIQLRIKDPDQSDLEWQIEQAIKLGREHDAQVFINDYWQLAVKHKAYGVHLGQEDLLTADLRVIERSGLRLGLSTHGYYEILKAAQLNPSYIALGHIFPTPTKQMVSRPQGLTRLRLYQEMISSLVPSEPTVAIGGIDLSNAQQVWQCGVTSLAVVRAITQAPDIQLAINLFAQIMQTDEACIAESA